MQESCDENVTRMLFTPEKSRTPNLSKFFDQNSAVEPSEFIENKLNVEGRQPDQTQESSLVRIGKEKGIAPRLFLEKKQVPRLSGEIVAKEVDLSQRYSDSEEEQTENAKNHEDIEIEVEPKGAETQKTILEGRKSRLIEILKRTKKVQESPYKEQDAKIPAKLEIRKDKCSENMNLSLWEYIVSLFYRSKSSKQKLEVIFEGVKNIEARLDIVNISKKLREIDKIKTLLLDCDQVLLFNNMPKPQIRPKSIQKLQRKKSFVHYSVTASNFVEHDATEAQLVSTYMKLKHKAKKSKIDEKLLEIFDEKITSQ